MAKIGVGGTKFVGRARSGGIIDAPAHVLAELAKQPEPEVLKNRPKYPPGDPRNTRVEDGVDFVTASGATLRAKVTVDGQPVKGISGRVEPLVELPQKTKRARKAS